MTSTIDDTTADQALKARHRAMWALGDYPTVAIEVIPELGPVLVEASGVRAGDRVLDVAAGSGNAAVPAAVQGASVVAPGALVMSTSRAGSRSKVAPNKL